MNKFLKKNKKNVEMGLYIALVLFIIIAVFQLFGIVMPGSLVGQAYVGIDEACGGENICKEGLSCENNVCVEKVSKCFNHIDDDGDGIYFEGKDKFISKVLSTKGIVYINILHW